MTDIYNNSHENLMSCILQFVTVVFVIVILTIRNIVLKLFYSLCYEGFRVKNKERNVFISGRWG